MNSPQFGPFIHLVVGPDRSGLFGAWVDEEAARQQAEAVGGVVASVPVSADFRGQSDRESS